MNENSNNKLTLSTKSILTLKNVGDKAGSADGRKVVQVEVRKKRIISPQTAPDAAEQPKVKIDDSIAAKMKLVQGAKEHEAKRKAEEVERTKVRQQQIEEKEEQKKAFRKAKAR